ncbi:MULTISPECIES: thiopeptide-type bacteriocin biosynthesis protein [unclassified Streptomyces]|uniref:thiopeptide-type bacteriocin biosynthesis protein n=1 Tax=unclassified Streptomyces TaxID=2593676 RepID=UPI000DAE55E9|nr:MULTISPECIES: thiopeptide-type bacteriocin biosynthesis protein [unclassified Streptomyces]PZT77471.1 bacteriocin biosynthesis protein [Streptomyces sp. AC1-42W]PZT78574.1 bacteriocin biosynthesis protein [Streptomyces sp. AC1-42T]
MTGHDPARVERAVHRVFNGTPMEDAARTALIPAEQLAEAVEHYQAAGRTALETARTGWHQVNIRFADYEHAARDFRNHVVPSLRPGGPVGPWWFVRKAPHWRLRCHPAPGATGQGVADHVAEALNSAMSSGVIADWHAAPYEPEAIAFGGSAGLPLAHALFHADSEGVLDYARVCEEAPSRVLGAKETSLLAMSLLMRAARLEAGEQGDVWGRVEERRPLPRDVTPQQVGAMVAPMRRLLLTDARPLLTAGPLTPVRPWIEALQHHGHRLAEAAGSSALGIGTRAVLARHVLFHWNRMGFSSRRQSIWSRAAREALLGS